MGEALQGCSVWGTVVAAASHRQLACAAGALVLCRWPALTVAGLPSLSLACSPLFSPAFTAGTTFTATMRSWACSLSECEAAPPNRACRRPARHGRKLQCRRPPCGALVACSMEAAASPPPQLDVTCCGALVRHVYNISCLPAAPARAAAIHHLISPPPAPSAVLLPSYTAPPYSLPAARSSSSDRRIACPARCPRRALHQRIL